MKNKDNRAEQAAGLRCRAEALAREKTAQPLKSGRAPSPEEIERTLHELRVHQIELEMQNEELRRTQAELQAARDRYFDLFDLAPVGYITVGGPGLIIEANLTAAALLGVAVGALVGKPVSNFILKDDQDIYYLRRKNLETGEPQTYELRLLKKGGAVFWAELQAAAARDAGGKPVSRLIISDITARRGNEAELLRLRAEQKLSYEEVQRRAHIGVWEVDLRTGASTWSAEAYQIFEVDPEKFTASYESFLNVVHPEDRERLRKVSADSIKKGISSDVSYRLLMKDGRVKYMFGHAEVCCDAGGRPVRSHGILYDITALHEAQVELAQAKRLSDIGILAATVAHELRSPLATITMAVVNIKKKAKNPELNIHLSDIDTKLLESNQLINNLLFYSRLKPPHFSPVSIYNLLKEAAAAAGERFKTGIAIGTDIDSLRNVLVEADAFQILEVLNNVLNNAEDATCAEGGKVELSGSLENGLVRIAVKDSGAGIDKKTLARAFDPFFTTKAKGTGLGLSICRQIMTSHGGSIELESEPGRGATALILLPGGGK